MDKIIGTLSAELGCHLVDAWGSSAEDGEDGACLEAAARLAAAEARRVCEEEARVAERWGREAAAAARREAGREARCLREAECEELRRQEAALLASLDDPACAEESMQLVEDEIISIRRAADSAEQRGSWALDKHLVSAEEHAANFHTKTVPIRVLEFGFFPRLPSMRTHG